MMPVPSLIVEVRPATNDSALIGSTSGALGPPGISLSGV
jgi:hypothetical protein